MIKPNVELASANEVFPAETNNRPDAYAKAFGVTIDQLQTLVKDRIVMDLGSGPGTFAATMELWKMLKKAAPARVDSVNLRYAAPDYNEFENKIFSDEDRVLTSPPEYSGRIPKKLQEQAWQNAKKGFLGLDWNDLSSVATNEYDVILSHYGFPYYSDLKFSNSESPEEDRLLRESGSYINFGDQSRAVIRELIRVIKPGGLILLSTGHGYWFWKASPKFQQELTIFLNDLGCEVEAIEAQKTLSLIIKKRSTETSTSVPELDPSLSKDKSTIVSMLKKTLKAFMGK